LPRHGYQSYRKYQQKCFHRFDFAPAKNFIKKKTTPAAAPAGAPGARLSRLFSLAEAADNSPQFQLRVGVPKPIKPRRGDRKRVGNVHAIPAVPPGLISFGWLNPQLKLRAIFIRRYATFGAILTFAFAAAKNFIKKKPPRPRRRPGAPGARVVPTRSTGRRHEVREVFGRVLEWPRAADWGQSALHLHRLPAPSRAKSL
jgi:hypothetical protein